MIRVRAEAARSINSVAEEPDSFVIIFLCIQKELFVGRTALGF